MLQEGIVRTDWKVGESRVVDDLYNGSGFFNSNVILDPSHICHLFSKMKCFFVEKNGTGNSNIYTRRSLPNPDVCYECHFGGKRSGRTRPCIIANDEVK